MKIGICTPPQNAVLLSREASDYIEINLTNLAQMTDEDYVSTGKFIAENKINVQAANCFFPGDIKLCGKEADLKKITTYTESALKRASGLGIEICVLGSGRARNVGEDENYEACYTQFMNICSAIGDIAAGYGITVVIEPLNKNETNMINSVAEGAKLVRALNHPNVKLLADIYHMALENEPLESISDNRDIIFHMHIANPEGRVFPYKSDSFSYKDVADVLRKSGYSKKLSIEAGSKTDFKSGAEKSLLFLKEIFI